MRIALVALIAAGVVVVPVAAGATPGGSSPAPAPSGSAAIRIPGGGGTPGAGRVPGGHATIGAQAATGTATAPPPAPTPTPPPGYPVFGIDVASYQGNVDWASVAKSGAGFAYAKATEGTTYTNPYYGQQYGGALAAGLYAGSYAFGRPDADDPVQQADYLVAQSQPRTAGKTLPYMLDMEWPYSGTGITDACWGRTPAQMVSWMRAFVAEIQLKTGMPTLIYTNPYWWNPCTNKDTSFGDQLLDIAYWDSGTPTVLPAGWPSWTFWQYADKGALPGDQDVFFGTTAQLASYTYPTLKTPVPKFSDVPASSQFYPDITWLALARITLGNADGTFAPGASVTRQAMAAFLYRAAHGVDAPACAAGQAPFPDVQPGNQFCGAITWLKSTGITGGFGDGKFRPTSAISREGMAAFLYRDANPGARPPACGNPFPDVTARNIFCGDITWLKSSGITTGYVDGNFHPTWTITRDAMARYLHRAAGLQHPPS